MLGIVVLFSCMAIATSGRSPHADYVENYLRNNGLPRLSDNVIEDALLDLPDLVRKYNYPFEEHEVTTEDGYILGMHRIPHGRDLNNLPGERPVVFLMHGLPTSSADHVIMGPGSSIAYILAEEGFDVWMGNSRGNHFSRRHISLDPDARNSQFWEFSWDEIGEKDLPAMIDYILQFTGRSKLHYIGFSQGTTVFFTMGALRPEYNEKIISMHALAPVAYMEHQRHRLFNLLSRYEKELMQMGSILNINELLSHSTAITLIGLTMCRDGAVTQPLCSGLIFSIAGWNENQHNATMIPVITGHLPGGCSARQLSHYAQSINDKDFRRYDFGTLQNLLRYGSPTPPKYDLSRITAPVFLHYSEGDPLADPKDVQRLYNELGRPLGLFRIEQSTFSHVDFLWGIDAKTLVYDRAISIMRFMDSLN